MERSMVSGSTISDAKVDPENCEHEDVTDPSDRNEETCRACGQVFVYCHGCSLAGGAERAIYHSAPVCSTEAQS